MGSLYVVDAIFYNNECCVITAGFSIPINSKIVGAISPKTPSCIDLSSLSTKIIGTGLVVCAVLGLPSGLIIVSQFP